MPEERPTLHLEKILFPTDLSEGSLAVYPYAADVARLRGGKITVLYLTDTMEAGLSQPLPLTSTRTLERALLRTAQARLKEVDGVFSKEEAAYETQSIACESVPEAIRSFAREGKFDMIVMGTHGRTGFTRLLCGSVAEETLRSTPCPILMVRVV